MCNCYRYRLDQLDICYTYSFTFDDCGCSSDHEKFVLRCRQNFRPYNMSSICCSCADLNKDTICIHCKRLRYSLNNDTKRVCLKKEDLPEKFKLIKIDNYLKKYISADRIFSFLMRTMKLNHLWIRLIGMIFSAEKKPCKYYVLLLGPKKIGDGCI